MKPKRIFLLILMTLLVISSASCAKPKVRSCKHNWERIDNFNEYTAMDQCANCGNTRKYTDPDSVPYPGSEAGFKMLRYGWNGYGIDGITAKEVFTCDLGYAIIDCLSKLEETGKTIPKISNETVDEHTGTLSASVTRGTLWIECGTVGLFRLDPEMNEICKVETHLGKGVELRMTDTLKELLTQAWDYFPNDYWSGKYENGTITLNQIYKSDSAVDYVRIDSIDIEDDKWTTIKIVLTIGAKDSMKTDCSLSCSNGCVIGYGDREEIEISAGKEIKVKLTTGGLGDMPHYVTIDIDNTKISLTIEP